jgi:hypothetical protein
MQKATHDLNLSMTEGIPPLRNRWFADSPLEEAGFELIVPVSKS